MHELIDRRAAPSAEVLDARDQYEWALDRLVSGEPDVAARVFARLAEVRPDDRAARIMLARAEAALRAPGIPLQEITLTRADIDAAS